MPFPTFKKQDEIPEAFRSEYEEKDGQWVAKVEDTSGLKTTIATLRTEKKAAETAAREAGEKTAAAERERDALKTQLGDPEGKTAALLKKFDADVAAAVSVVQAKLDAAEGRLRVLTLDDQAKKAFIEAGGRPERADHALKLAKDRLDLAEDRIVVKDDKGQVSTQPIEKFWGESFKKEMPELFKGSQADGGGAGGFTTGGGTAGTLTAEDIMKNPGLAFDAANRKSA